MSKSRLLYSRKRALQGFIAHAKMVPENHYVMTFYRMHFSCKNAKRCCIVMDYLYINLTAKTSTIGRLPKCPKNVKTLTKYTTCRPWINCNSLLQILLKSNEFSVKMKTRSKTVKVIKIIEVINV